MGGHMRMERYLDANDEKTDWVGWYLLLPSTAHFIIFSTL